MGGEGKKFKMPKNKGPKKVLTEKKRQCPGHREEMVFEKQLGATERPTGC